MRALTAAATLFFCSLTAPAYAQSWGCYDPQPGHPTETEKAAYVADISQLAVKAEQQHGVPAPAIAGMAIIESGYGFTRTALNANNLFGFKSTSSEGPGGRAVYVLTCQPASDPNNKYVVFVSRADAMDFVAARLAQSRYYKADTEKFRADMKRGRPRQAAIQEWLAGIADPYNYRPADYVRSVSRLMNDPISPSDTPNPQRTLYALGAPSGPPAPPPAAGSAPISSPVAEAAEAAALAYLNAPSGRTTTLAGARYMAEHCYPPEPGWGSAHAGFEAYAGLPVTRCEYSRSHPASPAVGRPAATLLAVVWMLNADASTIARWVGDACQQLGSVKPAQCGRLLAAMMIGQNGGQFPVAGHVLETQSEAGCKADVCPQDYLIYLPFRDGTTVKMASDGPSRRRETYPDFAAATAGASATLGPLASVQMVGRIANVERPAGLSDPQWLARNRDSYLAALRGGSYTLLVDSARDFCHQRKTEPPREKGQLVRDCGF